MFENTARPHHCLHELLVRRDALARPRMNASTPQTPLQIRVRVATSKHGWSLTTLDDCHEKSGARQHSVDCQEIKFPASEMTSLTI